MTAAYPRALLQPHRHRREHQPLHPHLSPDAAPVAGGRRRGGLQFPHRHLPLYPGRRGGDGALLRRRCLQRNARGGLRPGELAHQPHLGAGCRITADRSIFHHQRARRSSAESRSFFYLKPRALLTWAITPSSQLRLRVEHQLGQLDFGDFISSVSLNQSNVTAGNPDVRPDQHWQFEAAYERHFWDRGSLTISLLHQEISNILDMKPVFDPSGDYDTRGNIGNGRTDRLSVAGAIPTDKFRPLKGGRLTFSLAWQDSAVKDPLTGVTRRLTYDDAAYTSVSFIQNLEAWKSPPGASTTIMAGTKSAIAWKRSTAFAAPPASAPAGPTSPARQPEHRLPRSTIS